MTHPQARTKPRPRQGRNPTDRIILTAKGRALLAAIAAGLGPVETATLIQAERQREPGRATPCAPNRAAPAAPANDPHTAGTPAARPRTPATKSAAAPLAEKPERP